MARSFFGLVVVAALAALQVKAEPRSNVTCVDQKWSFNSLQQSPCLVSAYLSAQCTSDNDWIVPEIGAEGPVRVFTRHYARSSPTFDRNSSTPLQKKNTPTPVAATRCSGIFFQLALFAKEGRLAPGPTGLGTVPVLLSMLEGIHYPFPRGQPSLTGRTTTLRE
ncbi:hypothetical protein FRC08_003613 [Ceratobasidium sp. 394]|nr:hypothetical protein FRC08_003613 [Ceratobasidium sp. 394]